MIILPRNVWLQTLQIFVQTYLFIFPVVCRGRTGCEKKDLYSVFDVNVKHFWKKTGTNNVILIHKLNTQRYENSVVL